MKRVKPTDKNISPNQRRLRLMELSGVPLTEIQKKRLLSESVSMILPPLKHERDRVQKSMIWNGNDISDIEDEVEEDEIDLEEILKEMGYYDDEESDDLREDFTDEVEEDDSISNMSREELKQMIQNIVLDTMEEEDDLNEIIENIVIKIGDRDIKRCTGKVVYTKKLFDTEMRQRFQVGMRLENIEDLENGR